MAIKLSKEQAQDIINVAQACQQWAREKASATRYGEPVSAAESAFYKKHEEAATRVLESLPKPKAVEVEEDESDEDEDLDAEDEEE
jgi:hypothetical protein